MTTQVPTFFLTNQQKLLALSTKYIQNLTTLHITYLAAAAAKSLQSCLTLRPHDGSSPGSPVPGILQARTLEWLVTAFPAPTWRLGIIVTIIFLISHWDFFPIIY